jgi:multidrug efflux pump subunit AcrA (membrane-fusion protein)
VTRVAEQGSQVVAGTELFRVDERPVTALLGEIPMYRDLGRDDTGTDVAQLIDNLSELGYADCQAQDTVTGCVEAAIVDWQADLGVVETGAVGLVDVVFVPEAGRVDTIHARVGQAISPGTPVLDITGAEQVVSLEVEVRDRDLLSAGTDLTVQAPGGDEVVGTVTAANVVHSDSSQGTSGGVDDAITRVEVTLDVPVDASLLGGPADVVVELGERQDVMTVPINALVAIAGGGHGLEIVADDGTTSIVPVDTGLFAAGRVEVSGEGIDEGSVVGVAGR